MPGARFWFSYSALTCLSCCLLDLWRIGNSRLACELSVFAEFSRMGPHATHNMMNLLGVLCVINTVLRGHSRNLALLPLECLHTDFDLHTKRPSGTTCSSRGAGLLGAGSARSTALIASPKPTETLISLLEKSPKSKEPRNLTGRHL